jgi:negative regulator of replication initiation
MKTIEIENDVYEFLLQNTARIGEDASEILTRPLGIRGQQGETGRGGRGAVGGQSPSPVESYQTEIPDCLKDSAFIAQPDVVGKFLLINPTTTLNIISMFSSSCAIHKRDDFSVVSTVPVLSHP